MKRLVFAFILLLSFRCQLWSQVVVVIQDDSYQFKTLDIKFKLLDSQTEEPVEAATAYLIPAGDTLITHFGLSDSEGMVELKKIPQGQYWLNVEILGYVPFSKEYSITTNSSVPKVIKMGESQEYIDAASITELATPVEYLKDTTVYNAAAFHVGNNAMLQDLLKKMPGIEVEGNRVTVNGKEISELTVNGRTFFFGDKSVALSNLPARIVNRIKVIDKAGEGEGGQRSVKTDQKVMDVELKAEFSKGHFGNTSASGGVASQQSVISGKEKTKAAGDFSLFGSSYNTKDQLTVVASAGNVSPGSSYNTRLAGNWNSARIRHFDTNVSIVTDAGRTDSESINHTDYYSPDGIDRTKEQNKFSDEKARRLTGLMELNLTGTDNIRLKIRPDIYYSDNDLSKLTNSSVSGTAGAYTNRDGIVSRKKTIGSDMTVSFTANDLGKPGRKIYNYLSYKQSYAKEDKTVNIVKNGGSPLILDYDNEYKSLFLENRLVYTEPLGSVLSANALSLVTLQLSESDILALGKESRKRNDSYSSSARNWTADIAERLYLKADKGIVSANGGIELHQIDTRNKADGVRLSGPRWTHIVTPYISIMETRHYNQLELSASSIPINADKLRPSLTAYGASEYGIGNIHLRQPYTYNALLQLALTKKMFSYNFILSGKLQKKPIVNASWIDNEGKRFTMPVNARKNGSSAYLYAMISAYFDAEKKWQLSIYGEGNYNASPGYQPTRNITMVNTSDFDYNGFVQSFYGDRTGNVFYGGQSGFKESRTKIFDAYANAYLIFRTGNLRLSLGVEPKLVYSDYSLGSAPHKAYSLRYEQNVDYSFPAGFQFHSNCGPVVYHGFGTGFDRTAWNWDIELSKDIRTLTLSLKCNDLLNKKIAVSRNANEDFCDTALAATLRRSILLGVTVNFGKSDSKKQDSANSFMSDISRIVTTH